MRRVGIFIMFIVCIATRTNSQPITICEGKKVSLIKTFNQCDPNPWVLVFNEDFEGDSLDLGIWNYGRGMRMRYCNDEQQYYTKGSNVEIDNGILKIIAKRETVYARTVDWLPDSVILDCNNCNKGSNKRYFYYTSANIETNRKFHFGKFEAKIKIPKGKGFWPAFWLYGGDPVYNEIDIFEFWNETTLKKYDPSKLSRVHHMTVHYDYDGDGIPSMCKTSYIGPDFSQNFHIFTLVWEKDKIGWYVDGQLKRTDYRFYTIIGKTTGCTIKQGYVYIMNKIYPWHPMSIILNLAIQKCEDKWGNNKEPDVSTPFPSQMEVDWVRYYKKAPCQDIYITDSSQYPLDNELYNVIIGRNVTVNCNYTVPNGQQLDILAKQRIVLKPGFRARTGSKFTARIEPTVCSAMRIANTDINKKEKSNIVTQEIDFSNIDIKIFPNPNRGNLMIDFGTKNYEDFSIAISNLQGKLVKSYNEIKSPIFNIDLSDVPSGLYILYLLNMKNQSITTYKIIVE